MTALFVVIFWNATPGFSSTFNLYALTRVLAIDAIIGLSMMVVLVTGGLNLAVGAIGVCGAMAAGWMMQGLGLPPAAALPLALVAGAALGAVNGGLTVWLRVHSFVVTLATMSIFFGAMIMLTQAAAYNALPPDYVGLAKIRYGFWSALLVVTAAAAAFLAWLFHRTVLGRQILAAGANDRAARISGVPVRRSVVVCHMLSGALAVLAGLMLTARNGAALPSMAGQLGMEWLLPAFLAPRAGRDAPDRGGAVDHRHAPGRGAGDGADERAAAAERGRVLDPGRPGAGPPGGGGAGPRPRRLGGAEAGAMMRAARAAAARHEWAGLGARGGAGLPGPRRDAGRLPVLLQPLRHGDGLLAGGADRPVADGHPGHRAA